MQARLFAGLLLALLGVAHCSAKSTQIIAAVQEGGTCTFPSVVHIVPLNTALVFACEGFSVNDTHHVNVVLRMHSILSGLVTLHPFAVRDGQQRFPPLCGGHDASRLYDTGDYTYSARVAPSMAWENRTFTAAVALCCTETVRSSAASCVVRSAVRMSPFSP